MVEQISIEHHIQRHIIGVLIHRKQARFRDLRPDKVDTNLFSYHLKLLQRAGFVEKCDGGYTLSLQGLAYADRVSMKRLNLRTQPKIITMTALFNEAGQVLLQQRTKQPYIDTWTLPYGKVHIDDATTSAAAHREVREKVGLDAIALEHAGDCYIRVRADGGILSTTLAHVFTGRYDGELHMSSVRWIMPAELTDVPLAPAVASILGLTARNARFFEEVTETWQG